MRGLFRWPSRRRPVALACLVVALVAGQPSEASAQRVSVSVDVSQLDDATYQRVDALDLEKKVVLRLVQEGFAVIAAREAPAIEVVYRAALGGDHLGIEVRAGPTRLAREVELTGELTGELGADADPSQLEALHLEVAHKTVELVRQMPARPAPDPVALQEPAPPPEPALTAAASPPQPTEPRLELDARTGLLYRGRTDPSLGLGAGLALGDHLGLTAALAIVPASSEDIDVFEWDLQAGVAWSWRSRDGWRAGIGASAGVLVHHFSVPGESGTRADALLTLPLSLSRVVTRRFELGLRLIPGVSDQAREHTRAGQELWTRSAARLEAQIELSWRP